MKLLSKISENYPNLNCLTLINNSETKIDNVSITLCADTKQEKEKWIRDITEMKECQIKNYKKIENDKNILTDYNKVNEVLSKKSYQPTKEELLKEKENSCKIS